jgi:hypothetical protein
MTLHMVASQFAVVVLPLLGESFLERPTAFGVPLGVLLLFMFLIRTIKEANSNAQPVASKGSSQQQTRHTSTSNVFERVWCPHCNGTNIVHVSALGTSTGCSLCKQPYVASLTVTPRRSPPPTTQEEQYIDARCTVCGKPNAIERGNLGTLLYCQYCHSNFRFQNEPSRDGNAVVIAQAAEERRELAPSKRTSAPDGQRNVDQLWVRTPEGKQGGPYSQQQIKKAIAAGQLPTGSKAAASPDGPWTVIKNLQSPS